MGNMCVRGLHQAAPLGPALIDHHPESSTAILSSHEAGADPLGQQQQRQQQNMIDGAGGSDVAPWDYATSKGVDPHGHLKEPWEDVPLHDDDTAVNHSTVGGGMHTPSAAGEGLSPDATAEDADADRIQTANLMSFGGPGYSMVIPRGGIALPTISSRDAPGAVTAFSDVRVVAPHQHVTTAAAGPRSGWLGGVGKKAASATPLAPMKQPAIPEKAETAEGTPVLAAAAAAGGSSKPATPRPQAHPLIAAASGGYLGAHHQAGKRTRLSENLFQPTPSGDMLEG